MNTWSKKKFGKIAKVASGYPFKSSNFDGLGEFGLVTIKNVQDGHFVEECSSRIQEIPKNVPEYCYLKKGDVLLSLTGNVGRVCRVGEGRYLLNQRVAKLIINEGNSIDFLYSYIQQRTFQQQLENLSNGVAQMNLSPVEMKNIIVYYPDFSTQTRIASILSAYDELIETNEQRIQILEEMVQLLYTEWFVRFKFPGHENARSIESGSRFGVIPDGWKVTSLGSVIELAYGKALKETDRIPGKILVCGSSGVVGTHNEKLVSGPGIVIGRKGNAGSVLWVDVDFYPIDTTFFVKTELSMVFVYYLLRGETFVLGDAAVPGLNREHAHRNQVLVPPDNLINEFARNAKPIRVLIGSIRSANRTLADTRDLLIPQLVSGKREVK